MKKVILVLISILVGFFIVTQQILNAEAMTINTPDGTVTIEVNDNTSYNNGYTTSGTIISNINSKLDRLENGFISKLSRRDRKKAELILDDIFSLLRMLPNNSNVTITQSTSNNNVDANNGSFTMSVNENGNTGSATISFNQGGANITINESQSTNTNYNTTTTTVSSSNANEAMSESKFQVFYNNVKDEAFEDDKMTTIEVNTNHNYYNVNQVVRILELFDFGNSKIKALRIMYRKVVDRDNAQQILQVFDFGDDKKKARNIINRY